MMHIKETLGGLTKINQFFIWKVSWDKNKNKYLKVPCHLNGEGIMNAQDPANWISFDEAISSLDVLSQDEFTLGFYLTKDTGYWFIDIDNCVDSNGHWNDLANTIYQLVPAAMFEYSFSETGIHLIGYGKDLIPHANKNSALNLELYTDKRGIAFGRKRMGLGQADKYDSSSILNNHIIPNYFVMKKPVITVGSYDNGPREDWVGPTDDEDLLRRAHRSDGANNLKASFTDLFNRNESKLLKNSLGDVAESECDMALAMHLAFWTGCDAPRIERLMRRSALVRDKWDNHKEYLRNITIQKACDLCVKVLKDEPKNNTISNPESYDPKIQEENIYISPSEQRVIFKGCFYVQEENKIFIPSWYILANVEQFNSYFGRYVFIKDNEGRRFSKNAHDAFIYSNVNVYPQVHQTIFKPNLTHGSIFTDTGRSYVNVYRQHEPRRIKGDPSPFLDHVAMMLPDKRDQKLLLNYLAACVQYKGVKFKWCPVLQGLPGNGKSLLGEFVCYTLGNQYCHKPHGGEIANHFNDWLYEKLFIQVDEIRTKRGDPEIMDVIKPMITDPSLQIESKGGKKQMKNICCNFYMSTNDKIGLIKEEGDRRFAIFYTAQQSEGDMEKTGMTKEYINNFVKWTFKDGQAIVAEWLNTCTIVDEFNPATTLLQAPKTSSEDAVKYESKSHVEIQVEEAITEEREGFRGGWICWTRAKNLFNSHITLKDLEKAIKNLGYIPHPSLGQRGLTNDRISIEKNYRVRLYCTKNHKSIGRNHSEAKDEYIRAQEIEYTISQII